MLDDPRAITFIGTTDYRNSGVKFGIRAKDRLRHTYIIGSTGVGKSVLIENLVIQDIIAGNGVALLDPHGTTAELILKFIPEHRIDDVIYFAPFDLDHPMGFNPLEDPGRDLRSQVSDGMLTAFKKIWPDAFSGRMEYIFSNTLLALLEYPGSTLLSVNRMLADKKFREKVVANIKDPSVRAVWVDEFMKWEDKYAREAFSSIQNKVGQFTANPMIRNILGQPKSQLDFRHMMDTRKIFIANLSKGRVGEQNAPLIGAMLITKIYLAAMSRADKSSYESNFLPPFYMYVDEFQNFANDSFENILSEARKYKLGLTVAHQYVAQMPETIQNAIFGNVGTKIVFRTQKPEDAEIFEKAFTPIFTQTDIMNLGLAQIYLSLLIDGVIATPFSARTLPPLQPPAVSFEDAVIAASRAKYTRPRDEVEAEISEWFITESAAQKPQFKPGGAEAGPISTEMSEAHKKRQEEHAAYLAQKKAEVEARGGVWMEPEEYKSAQANGTLEELIRIKKEEQRQKKREEEKKASAAKENSYVFQGESEPVSVPTPKPRPQSNDNRATKEDSLSESVNRVMASANSATQQPRKHEASEDSRNTLKSLLESVQKEPTSTSPKSKLAEVKNETEKPSVINTNTSTELKTMQTESVEIKPDRLAQVKKDTETPRPLPQMHRNNAERAQSKNTQRQEQSREPMRNQDQPRKSSDNRPIVQNNSVPKKLVMEQELERPPREPIPEKLTQNKMPAQYEPHVADIYDKSESNKKHSSDVQNYVVPGWNEITPEDLAKVLGTKL